MLRWRSVEVSGGFLLVSALLFYLDTDNLLLWGALACALHEAGHYVAARLLGGRILTFRLTAVGGELVLDRRKPLSYGRELLSILAGPCANLLFALLAARLGRGESAWLLTGVNLALGCFNLLPIWPLDGGRALGMMLRLFVSDEVAEQTARICGILLVSALLMAGSAVLWSSSRNFTLLLMALWLLFGLLKREKRKKC